MINSALGVPWVPRPGQHRSEIWGRDEINTQPGPIAGEVIAELQECGKELAQRVRATTQQASYSATVEELDKVLRLAGDLYEQKYRLGRTVLQDALYIAVPGTLLLVASVLAIAGHRLPAILVTGILVRVVLSMMTDKDK